MGTKVLILRCSSCTFSWPLERSYCFFLVSVFCPHAKGARSLPTRKLLKPEQQMMTSIMNGFRAQPFELQEAIKPAHGRGREIVMLGPIQINQSSIGTNASSIPSAYSNKNVEESIESFSNIQP